MQAVGKVLDIQAASLLPKGPITDKETTNVGIQNPNVLPTNLIQAQRSALNSVLIAYSCGLGKTIIRLTFIAKSAKKTIANAQPRQTFRLTIVICPPNIVDVQRQEIKDIFKGVFDDVLVLTSDTMHNATIAGTVVDNHKFTEALYRPGSTLNNTDPRTINKIVLVSFKVQS